MRKTKNDTVWINYLQSFITMLVILHHAALAYTTYANFDQTAYIRSTHAVVDTQRWIGLDVLVNFNDIYFMSLMFLIGGLFLKQSMLRKGPVKFTLERLNRLFFPFLIGGTLLMMLAYLPAYYLAHHRIDFLAYVKDFFTVQQWPVGPPWFIWVLFMFNVLFALSYRLTQRRFEKFGRYLSTLGEKPMALAIMLIGYTWMLYVPLSYHLGANTWTGYGPFDFQLNRILLYAGYFFLGVWIGNADFTQGLFSIEVPVVKRWKVWSVAALVTFVVLTIIPPYLTHWVAADQVDAFYTWMIYYTVYVSSCALSILAFLTSFRYFIHTSHAWWDSLSQNAYMIYLCHFVFVTWIQFLLLEANFGAFAKFLITFVLSFLLSWFFSVQVRKIPLIKRYV